MKIILLIIALMIFPILAYSFSKDSAQWDGDVLQVTMNGKEYIGVPLFDHPNLPKND